MSHTTRSRSWQEWDLDSERGAVTWVTLLLLLAIASAAYSAVMFVPVYSLHGEVKQVVRHYGNLAVKDTDDPALVQAMVNKIRSLQQTTVEGPRGQMEKVPVVDIRAEDVVWERQPDPPTLRVSFKYERAVKWPLLDRETSHTLEVDLDMDISRATWGKE